MGAAMSPAACTSVDTCSLVGDGGKEQISAGPQSLREKTYITARADADTALEISARSQAPTARISPRYEAAGEGEDGVGECRPLPAKALREPFSSDGPALARAAAALPAVPENAEARAGAGSPCNLPPDGLM
mmetsp:Transcript_123168/g.394478  ORF Transcript_123168/g.394478 Transcript_123168/m.394478 type:complete len:132 (-) Transcript_123168:105-500(-)